MKLAPTWWRRMDSNHRRQSQQIYSLSPLATWVLLRMQLSGRRWSWWTDSNPRPADYKSAALPAELHQRSSFRVHNDGYYSSRGRVCQQFLKKNRRKIMRGWSVHDGRRFSGPAGGAVQPVPGGALPRRPLFRAGRPGGVRGLSGPLRPAVFRPPAAPDQGGTDIF